MRNNRGAYGCVLVRLGSHSANFCHTWPTLTTARATIHCFPESASQPTQSSMLVEFGLGVLWCGWQPVCRLPNKNIANWLSQLNSSSTFQNNYSKQRNTGVCWTWETATTAMSMSFILIYLSSNSKLAYKRYWNQNMNIRKQIHSNLSIVETHANLFSSAMYENSGIQRIPLLAFCL